MGTSINRHGPKPTVPLIPDWIDEEESLDDKNDAEPTEDPEDEANEKEDIEELQRPANPFDKSQRGFREAVRTGDYSSLERVLKNYVTQAGGGASSSARRMSRSGKAVARFGIILSDIRQNGLANTLSRLNLDNYKDQPAIQVLAALMEHVCGTSALLDDTVTRQAYAVTITRLVKDMPGLDLKSLTEPQVCEMMAVFLEESIVYKLICDVGRSLTTATSDPARAIEVEEKLYQIVSGLVHSRIVPELSGKMADRNNLDQAVLKIYSIAFKSIVGSQK
ncbi:Qat anti-phage system associated protein QatB [Pontibacter litorisediminis]|uniref:Qat anti-phage system associated protein QatB n=1 Tax=Pontibacter litorisediminis TaxID=1846260 RepID=UPI0023EC0E78|nr:Qat anti-phage system associated protein QatB [Pontibacter litorisediminis]